jgi:hypothetical protein
LCDSLGETLEQLVKHEDGLRGKAEQEFQKSSLEIMRVSGTFGTKARSLSGGRLAVTPTRSMLSASTPQDLMESFQEKPKPRPDFLPKDIWEFIKKKEEEVPQVEVEVDVVTIEGAKVEEEPPKVTDKAGLED